MIEGAKEMLQNQPAIYKREQIERARQGRGRLYLCRSNIKLAFNFEATAGAYLRITRKFDFF